MRGRDLGAFWYCILLGHTRISRHCCVLAGIGGDSVRRVRTMLGRPHAHGQGHLGTHNAMVPAQRSQRALRVLHRTLAHLRPGGPAPGGNRLPSGSATAQDVQLPLRGAPLQATASSAASPGRRRPPTRTHGPDDDPDRAAAARTGLTDAEVAFFKEYGFIVKRSLIGRDELAPFVEAFWEQCAPVCLDRSDPATFVDVGPQRTGWGPPPDFGQEVERATGAAIRRTADQGPLGKGRELGSIPGVNRPYPAGYRAGSIKWTDIGGWPSFNDATSAHPNVLSMVQALIGGPVKRPHRNRGIYPNFPSSAQGGLGPHNDTQPSELFGFVYLDDVPPHTGGTTIWPTSPQRLWPCVDVEQSCGWLPNERYSRAMEEILETVSPVEFVGNAGDVLFLHPLMLHSAGVNSVERGKGTVRLATVMEWQLQRPAGKRTMWWSLTDNSRVAASDKRPELGRVRPDGSFPPSVDGRNPAGEADLEAEAIWHHDAAEYMPVYEKPANMWARWSFAAEARPCDAVVEPPWWERHGIDVQGCTRKLRDIASLDESTGLWRLK